MEKVYLVRVKAGEIPKEKLRFTLKKMGFFKSLKSNDLIALKMHFGEKGNKGQIPPKYIASLVKDLKARNFKPFLVETSTLYVGKRSNAYDHLVLAFEHGYDYQSIGAPIIMADGLRGHSSVKVKINGIHNKEVDVASDTRVYDGMLVLSHMTGHVEAGFGATIKNIGMGLASRAGKRVQHSSVKPEVNDIKCTACGRCIEWCPANAITINNSAKINKAKCIGCGECFTVCTSNAIGFDWGADKVRIQEDIAEHALGVVKDREEKNCYMTFLTSITKNCDCVANDNEVCMDDIGVLASRDPVALDQASVDMVNKHYGKDFFSHSFPDIDYTIQLKHAEKIGLGSRKYELEEL